MAKKKGQRHRTEHGTHPSRSTMQVEDGKDNRNVRPPTADPANVKKDTDLDQQFAKLREDADKSLQEAQENARREAERQEQIKKVEAEANEMYRQKNADTVHVDDNDRYMAAKYQEQRERELAREAEARKEVTVEEAIAAYDDYVSEDDTIPSGIDYQQQTSQTDPSYSGSSVQTGGQAQYTSNNYVQQPIPEMPSMESLKFKRTVPYGSGLDEAQREYNEMMKKPVGETQQTSSVPYMDGSAAESVDGSYLSDGPSPSGPAYTGSFPTPESTPSYGGSQAGTSTPFFQDQVHIQGGASPTGAGGGSVGYQSTDRSGIGAVQAVQQEYERQIHERPMNDSYASQPVSVPEISDLGDSVQSTEAYRTGSSPETVFNREPQSPEYKVPESAYYPEEHLAAGYENHPSATQEQSFTQPSSDQTVPYNGSRAEKPQFYQDQNYDRSGEGMAQKEYERQMHERPMGDSYGDQSILSSKTSDSADIVQPTETYKRGISPGSDYNGKMKSSEYKVQESTYYSEDHPAAGYENPPTATQEQKYSKPSGNQTVLYNGNRAEEPRSYQNQKYDRSGVGMAQLEYAHQMHMQPVSPEARAQTDFSSAGHDNPTPKAPSEGVISDGAERYYNSQTREPVYKSPEGSFFNADEAVAHGIVTEKQVETDREVFYTTSQGQMYQDFSSDGGRTSSLQIQSEGVTSGQQVSYDRSGVGMAQQEYDHQIHMRPGEARFQTQPQKGTEFLAGNSAIPYTKTSTEGIVTDGNGRYFNSETREPVYRTPEGTYHNAAEAVSLGIVTNEQVNADHHSAANLLQSVPYESQENQFSGSARQSEYQYGRSGVGAAQQDFEQQMHMRPGNSEVKSQAFVEQPVKGTEFVGVRNEIPYYKTSTEGVVSDGRGRYYNTETREPVYKASEGGYRSAEEAVSLGMVTKEQVNMDHQNFANAQQQNISYEYPESQTSDSTKQSEYQYGRFGVGAAQQDFEQQMHMKPGSPETKTQTRADQPVQGTEFVSGSREVPYIKTSTEGVITDGRGRYFNGETKEPLYQTADGKFHNAEEAVSHGLVTKEQVQVDKQRSVDLQQNNVPYEAGNRFTDDTRQSEYQYGRSGVGAAQQDFEQQMHMKPGSPEAKAQTFDSQPIKGTEFVSGNHEVSFTKTPTEGVITDGRGRYFNGETKDPLYQTTDGRFHNTEEAVSLGLVTKEQVQVDKQRYVNLQQQNVLHDTGNRFTDDTRQSEYQYGRFGVGAAQQDFEQQMHMKPGSLETKAQAFADQQVKETEFAGTRNEIPYTKASTEEVITDGRGRYFSGETREPLYQTADGKFHNAEEAVSFGIVTKEQVQVDKQRSMDLQHQHVPYEAGNRFTDDTRQSEYQYGRSGVGAAQQDFEQQMHMKPGSPEAKAQARADQPVKGTEVFSGSREVPYIKTSTEGVITDGRGRYFNEETKEPLYQTADGKLYNAEEAISLGLVTKEQVQVDKQRSVDLQQNNVPYEADNRFTDDTRQSEYQYGRSGVGAAQQDFEQQMHIKPGSPETKMQTRTDQAVQGTEFVSGSREVPYIKTSTEGVITDGRGRYFNRETKEPLYQTADGKFHNAEEAVSLGLVTKEQVQVDKQRYVDLQQKNVPYEAGNRFIDDTRQSEYQYGRSGVGAAQQDFEQQMHRKPGSSEAKAQARADQPAKEIEFVSGSSKAPFAKTSAEEIITDGRGRYFSGETREPLYQTADGKFHNAEEAVSLGLVTKEQVQVDKQKSVDLQQKNVPYEAGTRFTGNTEQSEYKFGRSGVEAAQQDFEKQMHVRPGGPETRVLAEPVPGNRIPLTKTSVEGVLTDGQGRYFNSETRELVYKDKNGAFHNAEEAITLGVVTKEKVDTDRMNSMRLSKGAAGVPPQTSSVANGRAGLDAVQQQSEQRILIYPNTPGGVPLAQLQRTPTDGILTDGKGKFFDNKMEPVYRDKDGAFHKLDEAVSLGLVSKEQVEADLASRLMPESEAAGQSVYGGVVPKGELSGLSMAQQEYDTQMHAKPNDPMHSDYPIFTKGKEDQLKSAGIEGVLTDGKGGYFDSQQRTRLYQIEEGKFVSAKDAVALGIITEAQANQDLINDRLNNETGQASANSTSFVTSDSVRDKAKLVDLRKELGFGANVSGFTPDDSLKSFMQIAQKEGQNFSTPDAAFAQSRIFQMKLAEGLAPEVAYAQSKETFLQLIKEGHTSESIVASLNPNIKQTDIEFLKRYGDGAAGDKDSFAVGQLQGRKAVVGADANPQAKKIAMRVLDENGRPKKTRSELMADDPKGNIPLVPGDVAAAGSKKVTADYDKDEAGVVRHNLYHPAGRTAAIARGTQSMMLGVGSMGMSIFYQGAGESAYGLRRAQDVVTIANLTVGMSIANTARRSLNRPLAFELSGLLKANGAASLDAYKKSLNARFAKVGLKAFSINLQGSALVLAATKQMAAIKVEMARKGSTAALREAYAVAKEFQRIGMLTTYAKTPHKMKLGSRTFRLGGLGMRMLISSTGDAFQGVETVTRYTQNAMMAGKSFLWASRNGAKLGVRVTGGAINLTGKFATKAGKAIEKAAAKTGSAGGAKVARALQKYGRGVKKVGTSKRRLGKKINHVREKVKDFSKDPFGVKRKSKAQIQRLMMKAWGKLTARFAWLNKFGNGVKFISKIASVISTVASAVSQVVFFAIGIFLLCIIVLLLLNMIIPIIASAFNFGAYEETVQDIVVKQVQDCYEEDIQKMIDISGNYDTSTIDYDDTFRDIDKYNEMKSEADASSFVQSTNCAEIIAMTMVRFEYDMDISGDDEVSLAQKREIQKYIKELYYGSHELYVDVTTSSYQVDTGRIDSDGNPIYETRAKRDAALTYRTYYFEYMFDESTVTLGRSETPVIYTGDVEGGSGSAVYGTVTSWDDMYANMRQNGFTHEGACGMMANLAFETAGGQASWTEADIRRNFINATLVSSDGYDSYGIVQWTGGRKTNLINWCLENGYDHTTISGQLAFMYYEMRTSYTGTYNYLRTSGNSAYNCGLYVADHYEVCAEQYRPGRATLAETFADMYAAYKDDYSDLVKAGDAIVQYAVQYVGRIHYTQGTGSYIGTRYLGPDLDQAVYTGGTPTIGTDCSGFVYSVFKHFGITTPTYTGAYTSAHKISLNDIQPGDILYRDGHVGIYIGNGQLVQSSSCYGGDHSEDLNIRTYNASSWVCAYRYWE